jgi:hypothetical protein
VKAIYIEVLTKAQREKAKILPYIAIGLIVVTYGISVYYLLPLALISMNLGLLLHVFFMILMAMFQGLIMIAANVQRIVTSVVTHLLFSIMVWEKPSIKALVLANLKAHSLRNRGTNFIFASAIGFTIFLLAQYKLILQQNEMDRMQKSGTFPYISTSYYSMLTPEGIEPILSKNLGKIEAFTWISFDMKRVFNDR